LLVAGLSTLGSWGTRRTPVTIPALDRLKHKWDPAFASGEFIQDTVGGVHGLLGDVEHDQPKQFFDPRTESFEDRARPPSNATRVFLKSFRASDSPPWTSTENSKAVETYRLESGGFSGWGYGGVLRMGILYPTTFVEGEKLYSYVQDIDIEDEWIYLDLWVRHEYLFPHESGVNTLGRIKLDGEDALLINLVQRDTQYLPISGDTELLLNILQPDYTPYVMNLQPSDVNQQAQFNRWTFNRIQIIARRGSSGELHVWVNDVKIAEHTALTTLNGAGWSGVELDFQWGDVLGPVVYDDKLTYPAFTSDTVEYGRLEVMSLPAAPVWRNEPLHTNEPVNYYKLIRDPGGNGKTFVNATNLWDNYFSTQILGRMDNLRIAPSTSPTGHSAWGFQPHCFASPLKYIYDPIHLMGASHYEGVAWKGVEDQIGSNFGEYWDFRQWGWGRKYVGTTDYERTLRGVESREDIYVCLYFSLGPEYDNPIYTTAENDTMKPYLIQVLPEGVSFAYPPHNSNCRGIALDQWQGGTATKDGVIRAYLDDGSTSASGRPYVELERDRIYKLELLLTNTVHGGFPETAYGSWWLDDVLQEASRPVTTPGAGIDGVRHIHKYSWDATGGIIQPVEREQNYRMYYMYISSPDTSDIGFRSPIPVAGPPVCLQHDYFSAGTQVTPGHLSYKIPVGDDYFWVGGERDEWTMAFVFRHTEEDDWIQTDQYLLDSWHELFGGFLPSIVLGPNDNRQAKGAGFSSNSVGSEDPTKIQINFTGGGYISVADRPLDDLWHTLVVSFSQYGTLHLRVWLDGVKTYDSYPSTRDGRYFARKFTGDEQKQYMTLFSSCDVGEWWRQRVFGSDEDDIFTEQWYDNPWGTFYGRSGPVFFWDRQLMYNEILQLHEDLRNDYTTLPAAGPPTTNTLSAPTNVAVVVDQGICKATWDDVIDPSGFEVRFEVEISANSGGSWASLRDLSDGEPGGIPQLYFSARPRGTGTGYRIRVRGFNGVNYSPWGESADFEISEWAAFFIQTPTRDGGWFDGETEYPGTRLARPLLCKAPNVIPAGDPSHPESGVEIGDFYYYEAPPGKAIKRVHFYDFKIERNLDWVNLWGYNPTDGWFSYMDVRVEREEGFGPEEWYNQGYWGQHWVDIRYWVEQGWVSEETTAIAFDIEPYEHNSWYRERGAVGIAVDSVELTDGEIDNPEEPEEPVEPSVGSPCAEYQECWLARPNLLDLETYFIPGDTHLFARTLYGLAVGVTVASATLRILEYEGGPAIVNSTMVVVNIGDGSADLTYQLTQANTTLIGAVDARPYQMIVTLSDSNVYTVNAGIIKASAPASVPAP
jgi:hypothetical protein